MTPQTPVLLNVLFDMNHVNLAENQPEYIKLPAIISNDLNGNVTTRWRLTWKERLKVLITGRLYHQQLTFHKPVQPIKMTVDEPDITECL